VKTLETDELALDTTDADDQDRTWAWFVIAFTTFLLVVVMLSAEHVITLIRIISFINSFAG
jgi:hypothetical protein